MRILGTGVEADIINRLLNFQKAQIREGFELSYSYGSLYFPVDLIELVVEFASPITTT